MSDEDKPWWNDGDAVGGAVATVILLTAAICLSVVVVALAVKFGNWIITS